MSTRFPYAYDRRAAPILWPLGVRLDRDGVELTDRGTLRATFGWFDLETPLDNVASVTDTGPYSFLKAVGIRLSAVDTGLTFGTSGRSGACIRFVERVPRVLGLSDHAGLTVTVEDPAGLAAAVEAAQRG